MKLLPGPHPCIFIYMKSETEQSANLSSLLSAMRFPTEEGFTEGSDTLEKVSVEILSLQSALYNAI